MTLIKCGSKVKSCGISGEITAIEIRFSNVVYEFSYYNQDMEFKHNWIHRDQFEAEKIDSFSIGFQTNKIK